MNSAESDLPVAARPHSDAEPIPAPTPRTAEDLRGGLTRHLRPGTGAARFEFACEGVHYRVQVEAGERPSVVLSADLGALPFTVEGDGVRRIACRIIASTAHLAHGQLTLTPEQFIVLHAKAPVPQPLSPDTILATVAALALTIKPYLALLAQVLEHDRDPAADAHPA